MAVIVDQKRLGGGSHSTVGTLTDIYGVLRLLTALRPAALSRIELSRFDPPVLAFTVGLSVVWGLPYMLIKVAVRDLSPVTVVFARCAIQKGTVIERVPVLIIPIEHLADGKANPALNKYFYEWSPTSVAVSLGYGSLYNHSYTPNADYDFGPQFRYRDGSGVITNVPPTSQLTIGPDAVIDVSGLWINDTGANAENIEDEREIFNRAREGADMVELVR